MNDFDRGAAHARGLVAYFDNLRASGVTPEEVAAGKAAEGIEAIFAADHPTSLAHMFGWGSGIAEDRFPAVREYLVAFGRYQKSRIAECDRIIAECGADIARDNALLEQLKK